MNQLRWVSCSCVALLLVLSHVPASATAQASGVEGLMKVLPEDVVGFVAFAGTDAVKADFEKSILGRLWLDPSTQGFYESIKTELMALAGKEAEDANVPAQIKTALEYVGLATSRPIAVGVARVEVEQGPPLCAFAILDAGARKHKIAAATAKLEAMLGEKAIAQKQIAGHTMHTLAEDDDLPLYWGWVGDYLVAAVNDGNGAVTRSAGSPRAVAPPALKPVPGGKDALLVHIDLQPALRLVDTLIREKAGEKGTEMVSAVLKELGLAEIKSLTHRIGFSGPDIFEHALVEMPTPATGLLGTFKPVDPAWFAAVDARAVQAGALNWDVAATYDLAMKVVKMVSPDEAYPEIQEAIEEFESESKVRVRRGLLESLSGPLVFCVLPAGVMIEAPMGGFVALARLENAELFEETMTTLGRFVSDQSEGVLQVSSQKQPDGRTVHVWAMAPLAFAQMMPTWSVANDHVILGSNTALCNLGVEQLLSKGADGKSLLDTERYKRVTKDLPANLTGLTYVDARVQFQQFKMQLQQLWPMATMFAAQAGVKLPIMLPSLDHIAQDMGPTVQYSYFGREGLHAHYRGPGFEVSLGSVAGVSLGAGILMPALARARQVAYRTTSGSNLSQIGKACVIYANDHDDKLPPDLETLVRELDLPPKCLESKRRPKNFDGPSYIYVPGQTLAMYPGNFVAYEDPRYCQEGVNVLFLDGHVEFMKPDAFRRELKETYDRLGRPTPRVRFKDEAKDEPLVLHDLAGPTIVHAGGF